MQSWTVSLELSFQAVKLALPFSTLFTHFLFVTASTLKTHLPSPYYVDTMP